jgi:hypothetical protein
LYFHVIESQAPPCHTPYHQLEPVKLKDLTVDGDHSGKVLYGRVLIAPMDIGQLYTIIEDADKNNIRLFVHHHQHLEGRAPNTYISEGCIVAIKHPFVAPLSETISKINVDHVGDIVVVPPGDRCIPEAFRSSKETRTPLELLTVGQVLFHSGELLQATETFTRALELAGPTNDHQLLQQIRLNRLMAYIRSGYLRNIEEDMKWFFPDDTGLTFSGEMAFRHPHSSRQTDLCCRHTDLDRGRQGS